MGKEERDKTAELMIKEEERGSTAEENRAGEYPEWKGRRGRPESQVKKETDQDSQNKEKIYTEENDREQDAMIEDTAEEGADKGSWRRSRRRRDDRKKKAKKGNHAVRAFLRILQHAALAAMAVSVFIVAIGSTVRVEGFHSQYGFNMYTMNQKQKYEESELFDNIFGYAAADIIRHGVVSGQLETDGVFDGRKVIDVTAHNYRDIGLPERYVTASYYLEDLLKWQNYGFEWTGTEMTGAQARNFLADRTRVTVIDPDSKYYNTSDASYLKSDVESYTFVDDVSSNQLWVDADDTDGFVDDYRPARLEISEEEAVSNISVPEEDEAENIGDSEAKTTYNVLVNRYKTADGKNLEEYVSDWDLYYDLCHNVQYAAKSLSYNYNEYLEAQRYYSRDNSNVRYLIRKTVGENTQIYTNLEEEQDLESILSFAEEQDAEDDAALPSAGRYIYYSPADMSYMTNTSIDEETIRRILQEYDYAYPETVEIWIGVDTSYPAEDAFTQGRAGFNNYQPYFMQWIAVAFCAGILYLILLCYLTFVTGKDADREGRMYIRLTSFDRIPTEIMLLLGFGMAILIAWVLIVAVELLNLNIAAVLSYDTVANAQWFKGALFAAVFAVDTVAMFFFYSLVRRLRARTLWKNSYLCRIYHLLKSCALQMYDNSDIVLRTCVPYGLFLLFNLLMMVWAIDTTAPFGILVLVFITMAVDVAVGHLLYQNAKEQQQIVKGIETIANGQLEHQVKTEKLHGDNLTLAHSVNSIGKGIKEAVEISMKDERMKADLITNVSHDIKTPLTSIINYVDLIKRERIDNEKVQNYIKVLDEKSQRLKQLTDDLVEASKITSGNISLHFEQINLTELMNQTIGEFSEKFEMKNLTTVMNVRVKNAVIEADSRRIWRVMENLFNNIYKYAMEGTRVYLSIEDMPDKKKFIVISIKNISASPLNCNPDELTERFIRGDVSRTTEGSGLGLSIAKNLTEAQKGTFEIQLDGDLFKVILTFPKAKGEKNA